jgi:hypothetical protein
MLLFAPQASSSRAIPTAMPNHHMQTHHSMCIQGRFPRLPKIYLQPCPRHFGHTLTIDTLLSKICLFEPAGNEKSTL